jgi:hypothetical protein
MKNTLFYIFVLLILISTSCQKNYSDDSILEYLHLNQGLEESNDFISNSNENILWDILATSREKIHYKPLQEKSQAFFEANKALDEWIEELKKSLIKETGGYYTKKEAREAEEPLLENKLKGAKNTKQVEAFMLSTEFKDKPRIAQADSLDQKIQALYDKHLKLLHSCWENGGIQNTIFTDQTKKDSIFEYLKNNLVLRSSKDYKSNANNPLTWAEFHFQNQPLAAVLLSLTCIQNNIRTSENTFLRLLAEQTSYGDLVYDKFLVFTQRVKSSIQLGETYRSEIALGTYASNAQIEITINGDTLNSVDGIVHYSTRSKKIGRQNYTVRVTVTNPLTAEQEVFSRDFHFEVIP